MTEAARDLEAEFRRDFEVYMRRCAPAGMRHYAEEAYTLPIERLMSILYKVMG